MDSAAEACTQDICHIPIYIQELMENIFDKRETAFGHLSQHISMSADDPRRISKTIAANAAPSMQKLIEERR